MASTNQDQLRCSSVHPIDQIRQLGLCVDSPVSIVLIYIIIFLSAAMKQQTYLNNQTKGRRGQTCTQRSFDPDLNIISKYAQFS